MKKKTTKATKAKASPVVKKKKARGAYRPMLHPEKSRKLGELMAKIHKILSAA